MQEPSCDFPGGSEILSDLSALRPAGPFTLRDRRRSRLARVSADHSCGVMLGGRLTCFMMRGAAPGVVAALSPGGGATRGQGPAPRLDAQAAAGGCRDGSWLTTQIESL